MSNIAIALSGGIDSLAAAGHILQQGRNLIGLHFRTGFETTPVHHVEQTADRLGIPLEIIDIRESFREKVVDYLVATYPSGKTPNPCLVCNAAIKFGVLLDIAVQMGAERLATGHYARRCDSDDGRVRLFRGADSKKDQSYFLAFLTQAMLRRAVFPLGEMTKADALQFVTKSGLTPAEEGESQDICFIQEGYGKFLTESAGILPKPGPIVDMEGNLVGEHSGLFRFTVGQRRGIGIPAEEPYYVVRLEPETNRLVVGFKSSLLASECRVSEINWIAPPPGQSFAADVQLRYRHAAAPATITISDEDFRTAAIRFQTPQSAITPGQGAVFYQADEVVGAGWIDL